MIDPLKSLWRAKLGLLSLKMRYAFIFKLLIAQEKCKITFFTAISRFWKSCWTIIHATDKATFTFIVSVTITLVYITLVRRWTTFSKYIFVVTTNAITNFALDWFWSHLIWKDVCYLIWKSWLTLFQLSSGMTLPTKGGHYGPEQNQGS